MVLLSAYGRQALIGQGADVRLLTITIIEWTDKNGRNTVHSKVNDEHDDDVSTARKLT